MQATSCHVISCSETAATQATQKAFGTAMRRLKCRTLWSPPVEPVRATVTCATSGKGRASGVALISSVPARPARLPLPSDWATSTRVLHSIVTWGCTHVQVFTVYCRPQNCPTSMGFSNQLLEMDLQQVAVIALPFMIVGDFNCSPSVLGCWADLPAKGFQHLESLYQRLYSCEMPCTCKDATCPDTAILSPGIAHLVNHISVLDSSWLATRRPVVFHLSVPTHGLFHLKVDMPKSFLELGVSEEDLSNAVATMAPLRNAASLEDWGLLVEEVVDKALAISRSVPSLPKAYRGRCKPFRLKKSPIQSPVKRASTTSRCLKSNAMATRKKIKQLRRIYSLKSRLKKFESATSPSDGLFNDLCLEWSAIVDSGAFGPSFLHWLADLQVVEPPSWPLPSSDWLLTVSALVKHFVDSAVQQDHQLRLDKLAYGRRLDKKTGHKQAFASVRGPGPPPVTEVHAPVEFEAMMVPGDSPLCFDLFADSSLLAQLSPAFHVSVHGCPCRIIDLQSRYATVRASMPFDYQGSMVEVRQEHFTCEPSGVAQSLNSFWSPIWTRDPWNLDFVDQEGPCLDDGLLSVLGQKETIPVDMGNLELWISSIRQLKSGSARGTGSISAQELKMLPVELIQQLMSSYSDGFPQDFMHGLCCPLSKSKSTPRKQDTRPITILPQAYRLWSMIACRQLLGKLAKSVSSDITGLLPGRGSYAAGYAMQF